MRKRAFIFSVIIALLFTLIACDEKNVENEKVKFITITNGKLFVELEGNYTTGYVWSMSIDDNNIIECKEEGYHPYDSKGMVGVGGVYKAEFFGKASGRATITFSYLRTFEDSLPIETRVVEVVVNNGKIESAIEK